MIASLTGEGMRKHKVCPLEEKYGQFICRICPLQYCILEKTGITSKSEKLVFQTALDIYMRDLEVHNILTKIKEGKLKVVD